MAVVVVVVLVLVLVVVVVVVVVAAAQQSGCVPWRRLSRGSRALRDFERSCGKKKRGGPNLLALFAAIQAFSVVGLAQEAGC